MPILSEGFRILRYDRRGFGESSPVPGLRSVAWEADELGELLADADHFPAHVVGVSYGAAVALSLAVRRPELVRSVAVHEPPLLAWPPLEEDPVVRDARRELEGLAGRYRTTAAPAAARDFAERYVTGPGGFERLPPAAQAAFVAAAPNWPDEVGALGRADLDPGLVGGIDLPVLVTHGQVSPRYLVRISEAVAGALPNGTSRELLGAGHFPHISHPSLLGGSVLTFALERNVPVS